MKEKLLAHKKIVIFDLIYLIAVAVFRGKLKIVGTLCVGAAFALFTAMAFLADKYEKEAWFSKFCLALIVLIYLILGLAFAAYIFWD